MGGIYDEDGGGSCRHALNVAAGLRTLQVVAERGMPCDR